MKNASQCNPIVFKIRLLGLSFCWHFHRFVQSIFFGGGVIKSTGVVMDCSVFRGVSHTVFNYHNVFKWKGQKHKYIIQCTGNVVQYNTTFKHDLYHNHRIKFTHFGKKLIKNVHIKCYGMTAVLHWPTVVMIYIFIWSQQTKESDIRNNGQMNWLLTIFPFFFF